MHYTLITLIAVEDEVFKCEYKQFELCKNIVNINAMCRCRKFISWRPANAGEIRKHGYVRKYEPKIASHGS